MKKNNLITISNYAKARGVTPQYVYKAIKEGKIPVEYIDGRKFVAIPPQYPVLSDRQELLLLHGAKVTGSFREAYEYSFESFFVDDDTDRIKRFCEWLDDEIGGAGRANIQSLWKAFNEPRNKTIQAMALGIKNEIKAIRNL